MKRVVMNCSKPLDEQETWVDMTPEEEAETLPPSVDVFPNPAAAGATITITATLPEHSPSTLVAFTPEGAATVTEPVHDGQATHILAFSLSGTYRIRVEADRNAMTTAEVTVQ